LKQKISGVGSLDQQINQLGRSRYTEKSIRFKIPYGKPLDKK
jgi:hypothetical protein